MNIREYLNNNPAVVTIAAVVLLIVCLGFIVRQLLPGGSGGPVDVWFYDLGNQQIFVESSDKYPPIEAASGPNNGVRAYIFACGSCEELADQIEAGATFQQLAQAGLHVVYVSKFTDEAKAAMANPEANPEFAYEFEGQLVALVTDGQIGDWQPEYGGQAGQEDMWQRLLDERFEEICPEGRPVPCRQP